MGASLLLGERREKIKDPTLLLLVDTLDRQVKRLKSLVNNLLDLADLQQGRLKAHPEVINLSSATKRVLENSPPPEDKSVEIQFDGDLQVLTDNLCLEQMLTNLIVNAYRYGGSRVTVEANRGTKRIVVTVADDGPGVPADLVPRLFEPFTRGENAATIGGSGLGLSIVKNLAETCGGEILYEPGDDGGARFSLSLPEAP
jgi:two-component system phosphate regulon sensor histidine kinase PhoR